MSKIDLSKYGITGVTEIVHNPSYEQLFEEETKPGLQGFEKGQLTDMGAVNVMTGVYTGRSPKDKFFVMDDTTKDTIWWTSDEYKNDNKPLSQQSWKVLKEIADKQLSNKRLFVVDTFCGANENSRLKIRFIMEVAWQAHFVTNMFIRPTAEELAAYGEPDFVVLNASKAKVENYKELGLNSETAVVFNLTEKMQVIINTWYGGEMKKGMFSYMNYLLPLKGMASMHCSANTNLEGKNTAIFFGLSGTGKTTLLNILAGKEDYEAGRITRRRDLKIAYLEQDPKLPAGKTVLDACLTGDSPALRAIAAYELALGSGDEESLHRAMAEMDVRQAWNYESQVKQILTRLRITDYAQPTEQLSGGQVKRVTLAGALIREPELLILDEPTNHLDVHYQWLLMEVIAGLKKTVLSVFHELNLACAFCDYLFVLKDGRIAAQGTPKEICTPQMLEEVFRVRADVLALEDGRPYIVYRGSIR